MIQVHSFHWLRGCPQRGFLPPSSFVRCRYMVSHTHLYLRRSASADLDDLLDRPRAVEVHPRLHHHIRHLPYDSITREEHNEADKWSRRTSLYSMTMRVFREMVIIALMVTSHTTLRKRGEAQQGTSIFHAPVRHNSTVTNVILNTGSSVFVDHPSSWKMNTG